MLEAAWRIVEPVLGSATPVHEYEPGTWGPAEADACVGDGVGGWHNPSGNELRMRATYFFRRGRERMAEDAKTAEAAAGIVAA